MKKLLYIIICLLILFSLNIEVNAADHIESSMTVYTNGANINLIKITFKLDEENLSPFVFLLPFNITENNVNYDKQTMLFSFRYYDKYSICTITPLNNAQIYDLEFTNNNSELYTGLSLKGIANNGQFDMQLIIPIINQIDVPSKNYDYFIQEFDNYFINISQPYARIQYDNQNKKNLLEESENIDVSINSDKGKDVIFDFRLNPYYKSEESSISLIFTVLVIPLLMTILSMIFLIEDKGTKLRLRVKIIYVMSFLSLFIIVPICILNKMDFGIYVILILLYLVLFIVILVNCGSNILAFISTLFNNKKKKKSMRI